VKARVFADDKRPVILFDGVCNLCNGGVNFALDADPTGKLRFAALQSEVGRALLQADGRSADDISTIVLVEESGYSEKSSAVLRIASRLSLVNLPLAPLALLGGGVPPVVRDLVYDAVANNRYNLLGKTDECRLDDGTFADRFLSDLE
jgi:predicted DCC family thiol-disulfide oxidoreductase YuxK